MTTNWYGIGVQLIPLTNDFLKRACIKSIIKVIALLYIPSINEHSFVRC